MGNVNTSAGLRRPSGECREVLSPGQERRAAWLAAFRTVRDETERRAAPLSPEDQVIQSMADASPAKWHRAHTTWFFEQFRRRPNDQEYAAFNSRFAYLFNSYYVTAGPRHERPKRGLITRPDAHEVAAYRAHVDAAVQKLIESAEAARLDRLIPILEIGLNHEQQHQELMLTDILHAFSQNPTARVTTPARARRSSREGAPLTRSWEAARTPSAMTAAAFPSTTRAAHEVLLQDARIGQRLVTNRESLEFMAAGGYAAPALWLRMDWPRLRRKVRRRLDTGAKWTAPRSR